jgi:hypothetical protein
MHRPLIRLIAAIGILICANFAPALAQDVDPEALAVSRKLAELTGMADIGDQMISMMAPQISTLVARANPGKEAEAAELFDKIMIPAMREALPEMVDGAAKIYARHFTATELTDLVAFYETPLGRKLIASQPTLLAEAGQMGQQWAASVTQKVFRQYAPEFQKRGLQLPI